MNDFSKLDENEVVKIAKNGDLDATDYILRKYKFIPRIKAKEFYILGGDEEDLNQEGLIGLYNSILSFDDSKGRFSTFASLCVRRQMISALRKANRLKYSPLNNAVSYNKVVSSEGDGTFEEILVGDKNFDPEAIVIGRAKVDTLKSTINEILSPMEIRVFKLNLAGKKNEEISKTLNISEKSVYNAIDRTRRKISEHIS